MQDFIQKIKERILLPLPGLDAQLKMAPAGRPNPLTTPDNAKESGVLILLFFENNNWHTLLMQRTEDGNTHSGQISFPGGKKDSTDKDIIETAVRECEEEIGINRNEIQILGIMSPLYIPPSNFHVTPTLGFIENPFHLRISEREVKEVMKVPLNFLFDDKIKSKKIVTTASNIHLESPVYILDNTKIVWGATAMMISELEYFIKDLL